MTSTVSSSNSSKSTRLLHTQSSSNSPGSASCSGSPPARPAESGDRGLALGFKNMKIGYYGYLPNEKVLELMRSAHIGLLPTYSDTYGYSMLEFQAAGCPVISTDVQALPEINNDKTGWLIKVPKNRSREAVSSTKEERDQIRRIIVRGLTAAICEIMEDREINAVKANAAIRHISDRHAPEEYSRRLGEIYKEALL